MWNGKEETEIMDEWEEREGQKKEVRENVQWNGKEKDKWEAIEAVRERW